MFDFWTKNFNEIEKSNLGIDERLRGLIIQHVHIRVVRIFVSGLFAIVLRKKNLSFVCKIFYRRYFVSEKFDEN